MNKKIIGWQEWCNLPELGIPAIKVKVDTGAQTSCLHAYNIHQFEQDHKQFVSFDLHPIQNNLSITKTCVAPLVDQRVVTDSGGHRQSRYVIQTLITLGSESWPIEITLTNRDTMKFRMLLGRNAIKNSMSVDPNQSFCCGQISAKEAKAHYQSAPTTPSPRKKMNIAVLASDPALYSNRRLMEAGQARGHTMHFISIRQCYMNITSFKPSVHYRGGEILPHFDAVIPRIRPALTFYGTAVLRHFEMMGVYCLNESVAIQRSRDKLRSLQILSRHDINLPTTGFANSPLDTKDLIQLVGGAPLVIKLLESTQGQGVVLAETNKAAQSVISAFKSIKANILVQEFIKEAEGRDIRCLVLGQKVIAAMQRQAPEGEFRSNIHIGGIGSKIKITPEERRMAIKAAKTLGLNNAGVDIIRSKTGPKILEVNSSPGLEGIEQTTGIDIAREIITHIERCAKPNANKTKGKG